MKSDLEKTMEEAINTAISSINIPNVAAEFKAQLHAAFASINAGNDVSAEAIANNITNIVKQKIKELDADGNK